MSAEQPLNVMGDYRLLNEIGRGAMGIIYRAEKAGKFYALKLLRTVDMENILRFRKETASVARLSHPCLVKIVDANEFEGFPFMVMELLEGENLDTMAKAGPISQELCMNVAISVASALGEMHRYSLIHRDIKCANIVVTEAQEVKLLDFGLVTEIDNAETEDSRAVVGTILYASPEQCRTLKRPVDARSDLYSVGITLFQCVTGKLPFESEDISELMTMHSSATPPSILESIPSASPILAAIIEKLIKKDPDDRYQSAEGLKFDLENIRSLEETLRLTGKLNLGARDRLLLGGNDIPLAGRKLELAILDRNWSGVKKGTGHAVIIEGESGSGKSRVTQELLNQVSQDEFVILKSKCQMLSSRIPYATIREALDGLVGKVKILPELERRQWIERIKIAAAHAPSSITELSPGLKDILGNPVKNAKVDDDLDRQHFLEDATVFILNLFDSLPGSILLIDDVQWLDSASAQILTTLSKRIKKSRAFLLMTSRNDSASRPALTELKKQMGDALEPSLVIGPLTLNDVRDLVSSQIGRSSLEEPVIKKISQSANGNAFVVIEYIRSLLNSGNLHFAEGKWQINEEGLAALALSSTVYQLVLDRVTSLKGDTSKILCAATAIGNTFDLDTLIGASGFKDDDIISSIQVATESNLISPLDSKKYRFCHDKIREALIASISKEELRSINDRLAAYSYNFENDKKNWYDIARYFANGNIDQNLSLAIVANFEAGRLSIANYAYHQAYDFLCFAYRHSKSENLDKNAKLYDIARDFAQACSESGHEMEAHEAIDAALKLARTSEEVEQCLYRKLRAYFSFGRLNLAWVTFKKIIDSMGRPYPRYPYFRWIQINWMMLTFTLRYMTGFGFGSKSHDPEKKQRIESMAAIYLAGSHTCRLRGGNEALWVALNLCILTHSLGRSPQFAKSLCHLATIFGNYRFMAITEGMIEYAHSLVDPTDAATKVYVKYMEMMSTVSGDRSREFDKLNQELEPDIGKYLGPHEFSGWCNYRTLKYFREGRHREALEDIQHYLPKIESMGNMTFLANTIGELPYHLAQVGLISESTERRKQLTKLIDAELKDEWSSIAQYVYTELCLSVEQGEVGNETDIQIDSVQSFKWSFITIRYFFSNIVHIGLLQLEQARTEEEKRRARLNFKKLLHEYFFKSYGPTNLACYYLLKAGFERFQGELKYAAVYAEKGYQIARTIDNPLLVYRATLERARIQAKDGDKTRSKWEAGNCLSLATHHGWAMRAAALKKEFELSDVVAPAQEKMADRSLDTGRTLSMRTDRTMVGKSTMMRSGRTMGPGAAKSGHQKISKDERALEALTQVSLASSKTIDFVEQSRSVLDEIIKLFGAERAFVFIADKPLQLEEPREETDEPGLQERA